MTRASTTRLQVSAQRFQARRMERALRCGQPSGGPAPGGFALTAGCLLTALAVAGAVGGSAIGRAGLPAGPLLGAEPAAATRDVVPGR